MKEEKYLAVYNDLIVREFSDSNINSSDVSGLIKFSVSKRGFKPNYFKRSKQGNSAYFFDFEIEGSIKLNDHFKLSSITESYREGKNIYWKEVTLVIEDITGEKKDFKFLSKPDVEFPYKELQKTLFGLIDEIESFKTFEAIELNKALEEKDRSQEGVKVIKTL